MELMYSEPLSVRTTSSGQPLCFSSMLMTSMVTPATSLFALIGHTTDRLE